MNEVVEVNSIIYYLMVTTILVQAFIIYRHFKRSR